MGQVIKTFSDGSFLEYARGRFDDWCVYLIGADGNRRPLRDEDYFTQLKALAERFGAEKVYGDYVEVYDFTGKQVDSDSLEKISALSQTYEESAPQFDKIFTILYLTMIAKERKVRTRLGKRIKRLGLYRLLIENKSASDAANFMRGMGWREISRLCEARGF